MEESFFSIAALCISIVSLVISVNSWYRDNGEIHLDFELLWANGFKKNTRQHMIFPFVTCKIVNIGRRELTIEGIFFEWRKNDKFEFPFQPFLLTPIPQLPHKIKESELYDIQIDPIYFEFMYVMEQRVKKLKYFTVVTTKGKIYRKRIKKSLWVKIHDSIKSSPAESKKRLDHLLKISNK